MRDPMSRKLFKSRDAREKLRGMGGIMASSPELAQTVARFNNGGDITVPIVEGPNTAFLRQVRGIGNTLSEMQARNAIMLERERRRSAAAAAAEAERQQRLRDLDPSFNLSTIPAFDRFAELESTIDIARLPEQGPPIPPVDTAGTARERTSEAARILIENGMSPAEVQRLIDQGIDLNFMLAQLPPGTVPSIDAERPDNIFAEMTAVPEAEIARTTGRAMTTGTPLFEQAVELLPPGVEPPITEEVRPDRTSRAALLSQMEEEMRNRAAQEEGAVAEERQRAATAATMEAEAQADDRESRAFRLRQTQQRAAEELAQDTDEGDGAGTFDFDTTYAQMLERVGRVMGEETDKNDREKAMANLAMIGLAIAAGQSPDALTNIAQGALSGMQAIRAQEAREADLAREARLTALEMAESAADRASRERVAALRLGVDEGGRFSPTEPFVDAVRALAETALNQGAFPDLESAIAAADAALRPYYTNTVQPTDLSAMKAAEDQARAAGQTEFTFGGQRYPVRPAS